MTTYRTWLDLRKDPMYLLVKGRSKIKDKNVLCTVMNDLRLQKHQQDLLKGNICTTILPEPAIESENIMKWLDTKELGRYSCLSKETYNIASQQLKIQKHDLFIIGVYRWFLEEHIKKSGFYINYKQFSLHFANDDITSEFMSICLTPREYIISIYYVERDPSPHRFISPKMKMIYTNSFKKTNENRVFIFKQLSDLFIKYNGNMRQKQIFNNYIAKGKDEFRRDPRFCERLSRTFRT